MSSGAQYERTEIEDEEQPGISFSIHPYEVGCDVPPTKRVSVDVLATPGDGRGERVVVRSEGFEFEFQRTAGGHLELISPAGVELPEWARTAILEIGVGEPL